MQGIHYITSVHGNNTVRTDAHAYVCMYIKQYTYTITSEAMEGCCYTCDWLTSLQYMATTRWGQMQWEAHCSCSYSTYNCFVYSRLRPTYRANPRPLLIDFCRWVCAGECVPVSVCRSAGECEPVSACRWVCAGECVQVSECAVCEMYWSMEQVWGYLSTTGMNHTPLYSNMSRNPWNSSPHRQKTEVAAGVTQEMSEHGKPLHCCPPFKVDNLLIHTFKLWLCVRVANLISNM